MSKGLSGKRVLFIGRDYFFYTREIVQELETTYSAGVSFYPIEPATRRYAIEDKMKRAKKMLDSYHRRIIEKEKGNHYDIVFFLQVHQIGEENMAAYRSAFPGAFFLLYYWDSVAMHDYTPFVKYFDAVSTFDKEDAARQNFSYLPLFFTESFRELRDTDERKYDVSFVGTVVNMRRYEQLLKFRKWAKENGLVLYDYCLVSIFNYIKMLMKGHKMQGMHFTSISRRKLESIYKGSKAVLDLSNNIQSGYTMRTFETLGAHRKLITTNNNIKKEAFYSDNNIFVLDESHPVPAATFLQTAFDNTVNMDEYSLRSWIGKLFAVCDNGVNV